MSNVIRDLAEHAGFLYKLPSGTAYPAAMSAEESMQAIEDFARLIILECAKVIDSVPNYEIDFAMVHFSEHFGVE